MFQGKYNNRYSDRLLITTENNLKNCDCNNVLTVQKIVDVFWARLNAEINIKVLKVQSQSINIMNVHHETSVKKTYVMPCTFCEYIYIYIYINNIYLFIFDVAYMSYLKKKTVGLKSTGDFSVFMSVHFRV